MYVTCCRLSDDKVSIRLMDEEIYILPAKWDVDVNDLERAMNRVMEKATAEKGVKLGW